ncbi:MAG: hypothetical protein O2885_07485 [Proteobacteria bacterium]|nr:hypothetical protein [Pseudomonadota bacterium]
METEYIKSIKPGLIAHIEESMGGQVSGENITKIICPSCEKPEAWTKLADPSTIICNRKTQCGRSTHCPDS